MARCGLSIHPLSINTYPMQGCRGARSQVTLGERQGTSWFITGLKNGTSTHIHISTSTGNLQWPVPPNGCLWIVDGSQSMSPGPSFCEAAVHHWAAPGVPWVCSSIRGQKKCKSICDDKLKKCYVKKIIWHFSLVLLQKLPVATCFCFVSSIIA